MENDQDGNDNGVDMVGGGAWSLFLPFPLAAESLVVGDSGGWWSLGNQQLKNSVLQELVETGWESNGGRADGSVQCAHGPTAYNTHSRNA
jgi:hypothetical protein